MKKIFFIILFAIISVKPSFAADVEYTKVSDLTSHYFLMAHSENGTYQSPYWTKGGMQNVMSPGESAIICGGTTNYYLLKAEAVTYNGERVYRISIYNGNHELFPNGVGGNAYLNSAGWCFFAGGSVASGASHVYGQDNDGLGVWRITYASGKGFQFQCVGNGNYISYTMSNSSSANTYYWKCFAEGSLYDPIAALKVSGAYYAYTEMSQYLQSLVADKINFSCDDSERTAITEALETAQANVDAATTEAGILSAVVALRAKGCAFLNTIKLSKGYQLNVTPLLINNSFSGNNGIGWSGTDAGFQTHGNAEFYSKSYDFQQTMPDMPAGTYLLRMQGFQRSHDSCDKAMTDYLNGTLKQSEGYLYANGEQIPMSLVTRDAQTSNAIGGTQYTVNGKDYWMPNSMSDAGKFFSNGKYWNNLTVNHFTRGDLTIGLRCSVGSWGTWTCFDNFELYLQGDLGDVVDVTYLITNPSFETGTTDGWTVGRPSGGGDIGVKKNEDVYVTDGTDGTYLFNTWSISDSYTYGTPDQFVEQTLYNMQPGEYHLSALASSNTYSSVKAPVELYGNNYVNSFVPPSKTQFRQTYEVTIYLMPSEKNLTIGMRSGGWFRADNFRLIYYGKTEAYETVRRMAISDRYEKIASQALDRTSYDAVLNEVHTALLAENITDEEIASQNARLGEALKELIKTGTTATGQFDLTALLDDSGTHRANNINKLTTLSQKLNGMPAGHYTFRANAFYRPTTTDAALELYEAGTEDHPATIYIGSTRVAVPNIFDERRHVASSSDDIYSTIDGRCAPMTESTAMTAFNQGDYGVVVESDMEEDGLLDVGFRIATPRKTDNWFFASNLKLLYGATPNVTINKSLTAGQLTPLCVPFELNSEVVGQLYAIGSVLDGKATIFPVAAIHAGEPCVINAHENISQFNMPATQVQDKTADTTPLPWDGGTITGDLKNYTWTTTTIDGKTTTKAEDLTFVVADPMDMDFTVNLENYQARRFLALEDYVATTSSHIGNYDKTPPARRDLPNNVGIPVAVNGNIRLRLVLSETEDMSKTTNSTSRLTDGRMLYVPNLVPQRTYYYEVLQTDGTLVGKGKFHTDGHLRMIYAPSISNIRDLGGWKTSDGRYIKYEKIYRGGELNGGHPGTSADIKRLKNLGVAAEIDLRISYENGAGSSAFGYTTSSTFYFANANDCYVESLSSQDSYDHWKSEFNLILNTLRKGKAVYFHCIWGADRTGLLSLLLEGLLGMSKDQSNKNYEMTTFSLALKEQRVRGTQDGFFNYFNGLSGSTLQKKFNTFFVEKLGISQADINEFRSIMLTTDLADSIEDVFETKDAQQINDDKIYDLTGRLVPDGAPKKGVYIQNGKKILIK